MYDILYLWGVTKSKAKRQKLSKPCAVVKKLKKESAVRIDCWGTQTLNQSLTTQSTMSGRELNPILVNQSKEITIIL
jgi:hypothetical protein